MRGVRRICWICAFIGLLFTSVPSQAQTSDQAPQAPSTTPSPVPEQPALKPAELDALVAPIALYPDTLLSNVLMASTYPLEVVHAERWMNQNKGLNGDALKVAAEKQAWDGSVKALVATPSVLQMMNEHLEWTQKLGEAFLAQQQDVMDAVQRLRSKAYDRQKLVTTREQNVTVKEDQNRRFIYIESAVTDRIYVPYYEPQVVFGDWPYSDYPAYPYYWDYPGYIGAGIIAAGVAFGAAYALGRWATGGYWGGGGWWGGSRVNWGGGAIDINRGARVEHWQHDARHRQGARYNNPNLQQRFGNANRRAGAGIAAGAAGAAAARRLGTGANRANVADRAQRADRGRGNRQAGAGRTAGNRQARNRSTAARNVRSGGRAAHRGASRAAHVRPAAGRGGGARFTGGGHRAAAFRGGGGRGGGGFRGGGGGGFRGGGGRGGGRRSDINLKHDVVLLGRLDNGLGCYRFAYDGSDKLYVGVIAQEVQAIRPDAVARDNDGYLRVYYERLGLKLRSYDSWVLSGGVLPKPAGLPR
ncbi:DUF3300 domain-containing protein [Bradyrhizobium japonicum]|uniref:DUF3300 domain-containing protein n=1 Tax=Bradyrhizobium japonicum TaxID=375 RepID=UPI001BA6CB30|nr:DUF3300 domain-containing protein [Bradyrhizobium japonicum]MBR0735169.1 DUF3300 domain-containing protein [Bradyrhizobium japonicum]MBR0809426.1 DUF3300 domain-containing protein [Bradyrhizobium japonicum]